MKTTVKTFLLIASVVLIFGCNKENEDLQDKDLSKSTITQFIDGKLQDKPELLLKKEAPNLFEISFLDYDANILYKFTSEATFETWANQQTYFRDNVRIDLVSINDNLNMVANYAEATNADQYYEKTGTISPEMTAYMISHGIPEAASARMLGVRSLYDRTNFGDQIHTSAIIPIPNLGSARNRAESLKQMGLGVLNAYCDRTWFRSPRFYVFTVGGSYGIPDLNIVGWSNRIESISAF